MSPDPTATAAQKLHRCDYFITVRHCASVGREWGCLFKDGQVVAEIACMCLFARAHESVCVRVCHARHSHHRASQDSRSPRFTLSPSPHQIFQLCNYRPDEHLFSRLAKLRPPNPPPPSTNRHDAIDSSATLDIFGPQMRFLATRKKRRNDAPWEIQGVGHSLCA